MLFFFRLTRRGESYTVRSIAKAHNIPIQTLRDTLRREPLENGYPSIGRTNADKMLLSASEELVSIIYLFMQN